jgi:hypothetical protein
LARPGSPVPALALPVLTSELHYQHILAVRLLDAGLGVADFDAGNGFQVGGDGQRGIDGHGVL